MACMRTSASYLTCVNAEQRSHAHMNIMQPPLQPRSCIKYHQIPPNRCSRSEWTSETSGKCIVVGVSRSYEQNIEVVKPDRLLKWRVKSLYLTGKKKTPVDANAVNIETSTRD